MAPRVIITFLPLSCVCWNRLAVCSAIDVGSASLPSPISPQACSPNSGVAIVMVRFFRIFRLSWVACDAYICWFIAGAISTLALVAKINVVSKSFASPWQSLAIVLAEAGAITMASAHLASSICPIESSASLSQRLLCTLFLDTVWSDLSLTNSAPPSVSTTRTSAPKSWRRLTMSGAL